MTLRKVTPKVIEKAIIFISGVVVSGLASGLIEKTITWSITIFIFTIVVMTLASISFFAAVSERVQSLADSIETSVGYIEEPFPESEKLEYKGKIFEVLRGLVSQAEIEILALAAGDIKQGKNIHQTTEHPFRKSYLESLEETIIRHQTKMKPFKYVRIFEVPRASKNSQNNGSINQLLRDNTAEITRQHSYRILELAQKNESPDLTLAIMVIQAQLMTSFMIVDRRHVVIEIDAVDSDGITYGIGLLTIEDRGGKFVQRFLRYFNNYERRATELTLADFSSVDINGIGKPKEEIIESGA